MRPDKMTLASLLVLLGTAACNTPDATAPVDGISDISITPPSAVVALNDSMRLAVSVLDANGQPVESSTIEWSAADTAIAKVSPSGYAIGRGVGQTTITAKAGSKSATAVVSVAAPASPGSPGSPTGQVPELPRSYVDVSMPAVTGKTITVKAGDDLQAALDAAQPGDEVVLQAGATFTGSFVLRNKPGNGWIIVRSSGSLPAPGTRVTPAHAAQMPKLMVNTTEQVLMTEPGAHHWRLIGLEVTAPASREFTYSLIGLGDGNYTQNTLEKQPHSIVLDRMYIHGHDKLNFQRCVSLHSGNTAIIDSWISECHGKGYDSQAIAGWNGTGPYKIVNNHLEGAGENVMFGGADPKIPDQLPSDIEFRRNHVYKPVSWRGVWSVKNLFELKIGRRVLVEGNVFENNWHDGQVGFAIVLKSVNQENGAPWSGTTDVTFRYNIVRNTVHAVSLNSRPEAYPAVPAARFLFAHNSFERVGSESDFNFGGQLWQVAGVDGLTISNNFGASTAFNVFYLHSTDKVESFVAENNLWVGISNFFLASADGLGVGTAALDGHVQPGWVFRRNLIVGAKAASYPEDNFFPAAASDVGFTNYAGGDYRLAPTSPYLTSGTDGKALGPDYATLAQMTANVIVAP